MCLIRVHYHFLFFCGPLLETAQMLKKINDFTVIFVLEFILFINF